MRAVISQTLLSQALSYIQTAVPTRPPLPILSSIHFEAKGDEIIVSATDLYFGVSARCAAKVEEEGILALPGKQVVELFKNLPPGDVTLATTDNTLEVSAKHIVSTLQFQDAGEFPAFPKIDGEQGSIPTETVSELVAFVGMSCSPDVARPLLTGILWEPGESSAFVATDGFRLSHWRPGKGWAVDERLIIPARFWSEVERVATQEKITTISIAYSSEQKQITASLSGVTIYSRILDGEYPPYEKIIPSEFVTTVTLQTEELLEQVRRSLLYARDSLGTIQLQFGSDRSVITAQSASLGKFEAVLTTAQLKGEPLSIAFNNRYVLDFLQLIKTGEITIQLNGELKPALFSVQKRPECMYVVMPFRVNQ